MVHGFIRCCFLLTTLFLSGYICAAPLSPVEIPYIIDTDIGGDIDDVLALLLAIHSNSKPLAITTSHIAPQEKAQIAKLILSETGYGNIPVYAGEGVDFDAPKEAFINMNQLWPPFFGYPNPDPGEKKWYENQSTAYRASYGDLFEQSTVEKEKAAEFLVTLAKKYSPAHPLTIVAIGPLHNIDKALQLDNSIKENIILYSMGGNYPKGYNWLIAPDVTARVLSQVQTVCISSAFIEKNDFYITPQEFEDFDKITTSKLGKTIITDWKNWKNANKVSTKATQLGDVVTLWVALHPGEFTGVSQEVSFPCLDDNGMLKGEFNGCWYSMPGLEGKLITINDSIDKQIQFVETITSPLLIKSQLMDALSATTG